MNRSALYDIAEAMLAAVVAGWKPTATALPARQGISDMDGVWDCEQLSVVVELMSPTQGDVTQQNFGAPPPLLGIRFATIAVWLLRCVPDIDSEGTEPVLPSADDITAAAHDTLGDAIDVLDLIVAAVLADKIPGVEHGDMTYDGWTPAKGSGIGGGVSRFRVNVLGTNTPS